MTLDARRFTALAVLVLAAPWTVRFYARNERLGTVPETIAAGVAALAIVDGGTLDLTDYFPRQIATSTRPSTGCGASTTPSCSAAGRCSASAPRPSRSRMPRR